MAKIPISSENVTWIVSFKSSQMQNYRFYFKFVLFQSVISKGQVLTHYYRIMNKNGGWTWVQTCATVVCSAKNADEQNIICVNYVVSAKENKHLILDSSQLELIKREAVDVPERSSKSPNVDVSSDFKTNISSPPTIESQKDASATEELSTPSTPLSTASKRGRKRKIQKKEEDIVADNKNNFQQTLPKVQTESSVKNLEQAMTKHLPSTPLPPATEFSADSNNQEKYNQQASPPMPATALLRQLYANRESVIRAARPGYIYSDGSQSLPTPPSEMSYDSQYMLHGSTYGTYPNSMEYNNAMTPPSSVSPRESGKSTTYEYTNLSTSDARTHQYSSINHNESLPPLPLKPQPYSASFHASPMESYSLESQYFPHHNGGFHLYKGPSSGWFTPP